MKKFAMRWARTAFIAGLLGLLLVGPSAAEEEVGSTSQQLNVATSTVWPGPVSVC